MSLRLKTEIGEAVLNSQIPAAREWLTEINDLNFRKGEDLLAKAHQALSETTQAATEAEDGVIDDLFLASIYLGLFAGYGALWEEITKQNFSASWVQLQNCLDLLRIIKKFSSIDISFFENQLLELEKLYPYRLFLSIGMTAGYFECSICGKDINSEECSHLRGNLYRGRIAGGIARDTVQLDHVSMVENPEDKRCVMPLADDSDQFYLMSYLSSLIITGECPILSFHHLDFSVKTVPKKDYPKLGRNDPCFCKSGIKFKNCCLKRDEVLSNHTEIIATPTKVEEILGLYFKS